MSASTMLNQPPFDHAHQTTDAFPSISLEQAAAAAVGSPETVAGQGRATSRQLASPRSLARHLEQLKIDSKHGPSAATVGDCSNQLAAATCFIITRPADLFDVAELRDQIFVNFLVDGSFDPALLRICRKFYAVLLPLLYRDVDLSRNARRCRKFVECCERYDMLSRESLSIQRLHIGGDADFIDHFWRPRLPGPTVLQRLRAQFARSSASTSALTFLRVANRREVPELHQRPRDFGLQLAGPAGPLSRLSFGDDVNDLLLATPHLTTVVLEDDTGRFVAVKPLVDDGVELMLPATAPYAQLTLVLPLETYLRRTTFVDLTLRVKKVQLSDWHRPKTKFYDAERWTPLELLWRILAGCCAHTLDLGPDFAAYFKSAGPDERRDWAWLWFCVDEHGAAVGARLIVPKDVDLSAYLEMQTHPTSSRAGMVQYALEALEWAETLAVAEGADAPEEAQEDAERDGDDSDGL